MGRERALRASQTVCEFALSSSAATACPSLRGQAPARVRPAPAASAGGASVWMAHCDAASEACACAIRPGSGASAFSTIRPVAVGESMIRRSAAVTSSSSGNSRVLVFGHQVELDDLAAGRAVVDGVIRDFVARIERHRRIGLADRHRELERAAREIVAADAIAKAGSMNGIGALSGVGQRQRRDGVEPWSSASAANRRPASRCAAAPAR